jgi:CMP-N,N'-diacetyllegionaminic acid synthase
MPLDPNEHALAIVLARGGSKGLPGKNGLVIAGKPCLAWTLLEAQRAETVSKVVLSTDSPVLADVAETLKVQTIARPPDLAADDAPVDAAARHAAAQVDPEGWIRAVVLLYGNVPVRPPGLIDRAVRMLLETGCDSVQSYAPVGKHHPWWTAVVDEETGSVRPWAGEQLNRGVYRRQDLPPAHIPDGGVIALRRKALMLQLEGVEPGPHAFFGKDRRGIVTGEGQVVDIDSKVDARVAEAVLSESVR